MATTTLQTPLPSSSTNNIGTNRSTEQITDLSLTPPAASSARQPAAAFVRASWAHERPLLSSLPEPSWLWMIWPLHSSCLGGQRQALLALVLLEQLMLVLVLQVVGLLAQAQLALVVRHQGPCIMRDA